MPTDTDGTPYSSRENPKQKAGVLSRLTFWWLEGLIRRGYRTTLTEQDLPPLVERDRSAQVVTDLDRLWRRELQRRRPRLLAAVLRMIPIRAYVLFTLQRALFSASFVSTPVILCFFLRELQATPHMGTLLWLMALFGVAAICKAFAVHHSFHTGDLWSIRIKVATVGLVYREILSANRNALARTLSGNTINLVSRDAQRLDRAGEWLALLISAPVEVVASCFVLGYLVGWQALVGVLFMLLNLLYNLVASKAGARLLRKAAQFTDQRLVVVNEIISGIRALKIGAWEESYCASVKKIRQQEIRTLHLRNVIQCTFSALYHSCVTMAVLLSVLTMLLTGREVDSASVFTMISVLACIKYAVNVSLGVTFMQLREIFVGLKRMEKFLIASASAKERINEELSTTISATTNLHYRPLEVYYRGVRYAPEVVRLESFRRERPALVSWRRSDPSAAAEQTRAPHVFLDHVSCSWDDDTGRQTLSDVCLQASGAQLVMVTGPVGSGKSSLLMTILGELPVQSGRISRAERVAYVSQTPWVFSGTVRENIVFGRKFKERKYNAALQACDLTPDLAQFAKHDSTRIGERGVSLSGGQRARVSLARAVYAEAELYLLDDPLSAVDSKVGRHLFEQCICGVLSGRLRVLITHQLQFLHRADHIVALRDGSVVGAGNYSQLRAKGVVGSAQLAGGVDHAEPAQKTTPRGAGSQLQDLEEEMEGRTAGAVTWRVYWEYFTSGARPALVAAGFLFCACAQVSLVLPNWWLARMTSGGYTKSENLKNTGVLGILLVTSLIMIYLASYFNIRITLGAAEELHNRMATTVVQAPVLFFDTNPAGRILNRFSKDTGNMDDILPTNILWATHLGYFALIAFLLPAGSNPWLIFASCPVVVMVALVGRYYLKSSRELKRLEALLCSPVYSHISETALGLEVIRASAMDPHFLEKFHRLQDESTEATSAVLASTRWLGLRLDMISSVMSIVVAAGAMLTSQNAALAGLSLFYALDTFDTVQIGVRMASYVENAMTSVERVIAYTSLASEPGYSACVEAPECWPSHGALEVRDMSLVYLEGAPRVLDNLSFTVDAGLKVGVAGRTGAGKSSLVSALLRMPDYQGRVLIDGVDIGTLNLRAARRALSVITQDPVLFSGPLRRNLDPFSDFTDAELWAALDNVHLKSLVTKLPGQLDFIMRESGANFSVGERQLLCLARALLKKTKILIMDEATANVDFATDQLIQQVIRQKFRDCTVVTIAHRLNTITDADKVLVLAEGRVAEFQSTDVLLADHNSLFYQLVRGQYRSEQTETH